MNPRHVAALALVASIVTAIALSGCWAEHNQYESTLAASCDAGQASACVELQSDLARDRDTCSPLAVLLGNRCGSVARQ